MLNYTPIYLQKRKSNNHKSQKVRKLTEKDKKYIERQFKKYNGQIEGHCSDISRKLGPDISVFQVSGYIISLHAQVKNGDCKLSNLDSYKKVMQKHRNTWKTYKSSKYQPNIELYKLDEYKEFKYINFIEFYRQNTEEVEKLLWDVVRKYQTKFNPGEMYGRLIARLARSTVLDQFNPDYSKLSTYLTGRIIGYARHILTGYYKERNMLEPLEIPDEDGNLIPREIPDSYDIDSAITLKEIKEFAKTVLNKRQYKILCWSLEDYPEPYIAKKIKRSIETVRNDKRTIKNVLQKIFHKGDF